MDQKYDIADVNTEGGRCDTQAICGGSGKPYIIVCSYKNHISYRTHCKSVCRSDSTEFPYDCICT